MRTILKIFASIMLVFVLIVLITILKIMFSPSPIRNGGWEFPTTVKKDYNKSCVIDNDCTLIEVESFCPYPLCINKEVKEENAISMNEIIKTVSARSCSMSTLVGCRCRGKQCVGIDYSNPEIPEDCELSPHQYEKDICYSKYVAKTRKLEFCEKINNSRMQASCVTPFALESGNSAICKKIADPKVQRDECFVILALNRSNWKICYEISEEWNRDECIFGLALTSKDPYLCNETIVRQICLQDLERRGTPLDKVMRQYVQPDLCISDSDCGVSPFFYPWTCHLECRPKAVRASEIQRYYQWLNVYCENHQGFDCPCADGYTAKCIENSCQLIPKQQTSTQSCA